jgi:hypothetical protein
LFLVVIRFFERRFADSKRGEDMTKTNTMKRVMVANAVLLLVAAITAWAAGAFTVTATMYNSNGTAPYSLQSDGTSLASYGNTAKVNSTLSPTTHGGPDYYQWDLDLSNSSRSFYLTLIPLDRSSVAAAPFSGPLSFAGVLYSRCFTPSGGYQDWTKIQPGYPDGTCAMRANFSFNGASYTLVMSPEYVGTGTATVSCTKWNASSNSCVAWSDVPNSGAPNPNVAYLYDTSDGQTYVGSYSLSFDVTLTHP